MYDFLGKIFPICLWEVTWPPAWILTFYAFSCGAKVLKWTFLVSKACQRLFLKRNCTHSAKSVAGKGLKLYSWLFCTQNLESTHVWNLIFDKKGAQSLGKSQNNWGTFYSDHVFLYDNECRDSILSYAYCLQSIFASVYFKMYFKFWEVTST